MKRFLLFSIALFCTQSTMQSSASARVASAWAKSLPILQDVTRNAVCGFVLGACVMAPIKIEHMTQSPHNQTLFMYLCILNPISLVCAIHPLTLARGIIPGLIGNIAGFTAPTCIKPFLGYVYE